ncbi:hypothetical protein CORC01_14124 [Colletotrichum orchidophilum]|uniref:Uncharacterized protein n=1 Tax=Colletotrichum orchidophilum TaxID=1209926 RepID=A0A1G4AN35_9PEZI|nr:uncharacterized protein CORC01_14124 [Colletotrichum orchidophilum]OHE90577.1 hypothetical protein CORC01_14124 [Colletotrichum orchidophilum]
MQAELEQKDAELADLRKRWKQTAKELNRLKTSQRRGLYQVTDRYLVDLASRLRYNIRNIAIQYFEGSQEIRDPRHETTESIYSRYFTQVAPDAQRRSAYLGSNRGRSSVGQAFLWQIIIVEVFGQYLWTGSKLSGAINILNDHMRQDRHPSAEFDIEACRNFQSWSAETTGMVLQTIEEKQEPEVSQFLNRVVKKIAAGIVDAILSIIDVADEDGLELEIGMILHEALALDKEVCRQVARVDWTADKTPTNFDPDTMELEGDVELGTHGQTACLVVAPGLRKRGKSSGEDFDVDELLLPMVVSCFNTGS